MNDCKNTKPEEITRERSLGEAVHFVDSDTSELQMASDSEAKAILGNANTAIRLKLKNQG